MEDPQTDAMAASRLAQIAPLIRGLLASATGDEDMPWWPVILKPRAGQEAKDTAARPALCLDPPSIDRGAPAPAALRQELSQALGEYMAQHGVRPQAVCLRGLGILAVAEEAPDNSTKDPPLKNKVAVVTGAAGAIGHGICQGLLEQGCFVAATDLAGPNLEELIQEFTEEYDGAYAGRILGVTMDVTDPASVARGFECVSQAWGGVDIVVINAGIAHVAALTELPLETFQKLEKVNVEGTLLTLAEGARLMTLQGTGGDMILVSTKNVFAPGARFGAYSATKAASHQLARIASLELAEFGIRVNMVAPDGVFSGGKQKSGLWATVGPDRMKARGLDEKGLEEYYRNRNLLKARITARHVANAVLFFATHQTPTTGATIPVDGGLPDATPR